MTHILRRRRAHITQLGALPARKHGSGIELLVSKRILMDFLFPRQKALPNNSLVINLLFTGTRLITGFLASLQFIEPPFRNWSWRSWSLFAAELYI